MHLGGASGCPRPRADHQARLVRPFRLRGTHRYHPPGVGSETDSDRPIPTVRCRCWTRQPFRPWPTRCARAGRSRFGSICREGLEVFSRGSKIRQRELYLALRRTAREEDAQLCALLMQGHCILGWRDAQPRLQIGH
eukprot:scaffold38025_cov25-Tisochrysis_lutea.AAC.7